MTLSHEQLRKIDTLVAEKVILRVPIISKEAAIELSKIANSPGKISFIEEMLNVEIRHFTTDIGEAWKLIPLARHFRLSKSSIAGKYNLEYQLKSDQPWNGVIMSCEPFDFDEIPLKICIFALKAKGIDVDKELL